MKELYPETKMDTEKAKKMAEAHADWYWSVTKALLVSFGVHFYGHGVKDTIERVTRENDEAVAEAVKKMYPEMEKWSSTQKKE